MIFLKKVKLKNNNNYMKYSITQYGSPLDKSLYTIDEKTKTFSSKENNLVLDFSRDFDWTFNTNHFCTFTTGSNCTFNTGAYCTFDTDYFCTFNTSYSCTFTTKFKCVVVRRDIYEVIELKEGIKTTLNKCGIKGYTEGESLKGKTVTVEVGGKKYEAIIK